MAPLPTPLEIVIARSANRYVARHLLPWSLPMVAWSAGFDSRQGPPAGAQGSSKLPPLERLDRPTQERVRRRLRDIAVEPENFRFSEPLKNSFLRSAHVGGLRIVLHIAGNQLRVTDIEPRGQVYRNLRRR